MQRNQYKAWYKECKVKQCDKTDDNVWRVQVNYRLWKGKQDRGTGKQGKPTFVHLSYDKKDC